ncbi:TonB-dependent receptor domain-containing protein [candidate division KSB1 bacterium]
MKLRYRILNIILVLLVSVSYGFGQFNSSMEMSDNGKLPASLLKRISVNLNRVTFEHALNTICDNSGIVLNYSGDYIPLKEIVSINLDNVPAIQALMKVLGDTNTGLKVTQGGLLAIVPIKKSRPEIKGVVVEKNTGQPLPRANIIVAGTKYGSAADERGRFRINGLSPGIYSIVVTYSGYERKIIENAIIDEDNPSEFFIELRETVTPLDEIVVTPGYFSKTANNIATDGTIRADNLREFPHFSEDIFLAVKRLSGFSGDDFTAKFGVRGGEQDEVLMMLDGLELYDPFHLKEFGGVLSIIDMEAVSSVDVLTGGFPAEYGKRKSGVVNLKSENGPLTETRTSMGLSIMNGRFLSEGPIQGDRGRWLFSARRGLIDYALKITSEDDELHPEYYDILGKLEYRLNDNHTISTHFLRAGDRLKFEDADNDNSDSSYDDIYGWINLRSYFGDNLFAHTTISTGLLNYDRYGVLFFKDFDDTDFRVDDYKRFRFAGIKQNWNFNMSDRLFFKGGFDYKKVSVGYDYFSKKVKTITFVSPDLGLHWRQEVETTSENINPSGQEFSAYLSNRLKLANPLVFEAGLRYDWHSYVSMSTLSPRLNLAYFLGKSTILKAAWGKFYQTQGIHELNIQDQDTKFHEPERSEHMVLGLEHKFDNGINLKISSYRKNLTNLRPRFKNIYNVIDVFPEASSDRILYQPEKGIAKGVELFMRKETGLHMTWWASYVYSTSIDFFRFYSAPKFSDQAHTVDLNFNYRLNEKWGINISWLYHTGWPYTESFLEFDSDYVPGVGQIDNSLVRIISNKYNSKRLPEYHRMDIRVLRNFNFREGRFGVFFELINAYNNQNIRNVEYYIGDNNKSEIPGPYAQRVDHYWLGFLPSFGISWDF